MKKILIVFSIVLFSLSACKRDDNANKDNGFDRSKMLVHLADNLIIPSYEQAIHAVSNLQSALLQFENEKSIEKLQLAQAAWKAAYEEWQYATLYNFGPASEQGLSKSLREEIATFPVSESKIALILNGGSFSFSDFNRDARGFLAVEYLLFQGTTVSNDSVLTLFTTQNKRLEYGKACVEAISTRLSSVLNEWKNNYQKSFIKEIGTDVGSSTALLYNEFVKSFETIKNIKIELPLGKRPGQIKEEPQLVEAYYSGYSLDFLKAHIQAIENFYFGKNREGIEGTGFKHYVESVTGGKELVTSTINQWNEVTNALSAIPTQLPLSETLLSDPSSVDAFRIALQKHTRFFKSDMSSLLGIAITYSSGDGD